MNDKNMQLSMYVHIILTSCIVLASIPCVFGAEANTSLNITNVLPTLGNFSIVTNLNFNYSGSSSFWCNATVTDLNGIDDIFKVNSTFWNIAEANENSIDNESYHYTNSSCELVNATNTSKYVYCQFTIGDIRLGNWNCKINAFDNSGDASNTITVVVHQCGDGNCDYGETCSTCELDCGGCGDQQDESGCSSGYVTPKSYYLLESTGVFERCVVVGDDIAFNVSKDSHHIKIISLTSDSVTIEVNSTPINALIPVGETRFFDLDEDGWYDISIHLKKITAGRICLIIETFAKKLVETTEQNVITEPDYNKCGDGVCQGVENCENCASDCDPCSTEAPASNNESVITPLQGGIFTIAVLGSIGLSIYLSRKFSHTTRFKGRR